MIARKYTRQDLVYLCVLCILFCPFIFRFIDGEFFLSSPMSIIFTSLLLTVCSIIGFKDNLPKAEALVLLITLPLLLLSLLKNGSYGVVLIFYNVIMLLLALNNVSFSVKQVKFFRLVTILLLSYLMVSFSYVWKYDLLWIYDGDRGVNQNTYGILVLLLYLNVICLLDLMVERRRRKLFLYAISTIFAIIIIEMSQCRSALLALLFFLALHFCKKEHYKKILFLLIIVGFLFPLIYILMYEMLGDITLLGKSLYTGRQVVWSNVWNTIKASPFLGTGTTIPIENVNGRFTDSAHNTYLGFWKTLGLIPVVSFIYFLFSGKNILAITEKNSISRKAFLCCMVICIVETLLNDSNYNYFVLFLLMNIHDTPGLKERRTS